MDKLFFLIRRGFASLLLTGLRLRNFLIGKNNKQKLFYAEYFTDKHIRENFFPDFGYKGCVIEVGCATPELLSMSKHFRDNGWRYIGIEPNPKFVKMHRDLGHTIYEYAAADFEADDYEFTVAEARDNYSDTDLSAHSYSSLKIKQDYADYKNNALKNFKQTQIRVKVRKLDDILKENCPDLETVDLLSVDVEGYELEVMKGFSPAAYNTKVVVLENLFYYQEYTDYMESVGYKLHSNIKYNYIYVPAGDDKP